MSEKTQRPRNLVHRAMLQTKRGGAHAKTPKRQRANGKVAFKRSLRDEGGFSGRVLAQH